MGIFSFSFVMNDFTQPSAFSRAIGGAIYPLYEGAQSITYNPAGLMNYKNEIFFSHTEHFLGVIRNEFLSSSVEIGHFSLGGSVQYTYPIDQLAYDQYKFTFCTAYGWKKNSIGFEFNTWKGSDIKEGISLDAGMILNYMNVNFALTIKNIFAGITWESTPLSEESYSPEVIVSGAYFTSKFVTSAYLNLNSAEMGIGAIFPITDVFKALGGYKMVFGKNFSKELSVGVRTSYYNFILDLSYVFKDALRYGDAISPFYVSLTYDFEKGM